MTYYGYSFHGLVVLVRYVASGGVTACASKERLESLASARKTDKRVGNELMAYITSISLKNDVSFLCRRPPGIHTVIDRFFKNDK